MMVSSPLHRVFGVLVVTASFCAVAMFVVSLTNSQKAHAETTKEQRSRCKGAEVNLNFVDAELTVVIEALSKATKKRFIVHDAPAKTRLTIVSPTPVCPDEAYEAFLSALAMEGLAVIKQGRFHVVTTAAKAVRSAVPIVIDR